MTEGYIQTALAATLIDRGHTHIVPNTYVFNSEECDLVSVLRSGYVHEYEIKVSVSDFKADAKKLKHVWMNPKLPKHDPVYVNGYGEKSLLTANCFWYVVPQGLIDASDVPEYAGLIYMIESKPPYLAQPKQIKRAPFIHKTKIGERQMAYLVRGLGIRYWRERSEHRRASAA